MVENRDPQCARCSTKICENRGGKMTNGAPSLEKLPGFCPMKLMPEVFSEAAAEYDKSAVREFARLASVQEFQGFELLPDGVRAKLPRIEELIQFARKCDYKKLGIAHCGGLIKEAGILTDILEKNGFEIVSVQCKAGCVPKEEIGIQADEKILGPEKLGDDVQSHCSGNDSQPRAGGHGHHAGALHRARHPVYKILRCSVDRAGCKG